MAPTSLRVISWNVNGLRACEKKGFSRWLSRSGAGIVGLQEVRALPEDLPNKLVRPRSWHVNLSAAERKGYSGVGLYSKQAPTEVKTHLGHKHFDIEGRLQIARFGKLSVVNGYFPKGSGKDRDNSRVPYKLAFYREVFDCAQRLRRSGQRVLVMGDFNTAHREIDLARPKGNESTSGFLPEERAELDRWLDAGWVDSFRAFEPGPDHYSWWSQRGGCRERNVGWRIDLVLASPAAMRFAKGAFILPKVKGSDHCPIGIDLDPEILG
jgi:exodeoxyribonuclease-3